MAGPGKRGRKAIDIPLDKVEALAAQGMTDEQICHIIGISHETFYKRQRENPELVEAVKRGKAKGIATIANVIFQKAKNGDFASAAFFLERRGGWKREDKLNLGGEISHDHEVGPGVQRVLEALGIPAEPRRTKAGNRGDRKK